MSTPPHNVLVTKARRKGIMYHDLEVLKMIKEQNPNCVIITVHEKSKDKL